MHRRLALALVASTYAAQAVAAGPAPKHCSSIAQNLLSGQAGGEENR